MNHSDRARQDQGLIVLLGVLTAAAPLSIDMYIPGLPAISGEFGVDAAAAQRSLSSFFLGLAGGQLALGPLSDRFGRRRMMMLGLTIYLLGTALCLASTGMNALTGARFVQGFGAAAGPVISRAIIRDLFTGASAARAMSFVIMVMGAAPLVAPFIGGLIMQWADWRTIFGVLGGYGLLALVLMSRGLTETNPAGRRQGVSLPARFLAYRTVLVDRYALSQLFIGGAIFGGLFAYIAGAPFIFIEHFGVSPDRFGMILAANVCGMLVGTYCNGSLVRRLGTRRLLWVGLAVSSSAGLAFAVWAIAGTPPLVGIWLLLFGYVGMIGLVAGNTMANLLDRYPENAGAASALFGVFQFSFGAGTSGLVGTLSRDPILGTALVMAAMGLVALAAHRIGVALRDTPAPAIPR